MDQLLATATQYEVDDHRIISSLRFPPSLPVDFFHPICHPAVNTIGSPFPAQYQRRACDSDKAG